MLRRVWPLFLAAFTLASCSSQDADLSPTRVLGLVVDERGEPLGNVLVTADEGSQTASDVSGTFALKVPAGDRVLRFSAAGRAPAYQALTVAEDATQAVEVTMLATTRTMSLDVGAAAQVITVGEAELQFPQGSVVDANGQPVTGPVEVTATWLSGSDAVDRAPIPLVGQNGEQAGDLESFGMINVTLRTADGSPANIAEGQTVRLTVPAQTGAPSEAGLFFGDPEQALWVQEGLATNDGTVWTAELPHLSWWNVDGFFKTPEERRACVTFQATTPGGEPLSGVYVRMKWGDRGQFAARGHTESDGTLCNEGFDTAHSVDYNYIGGVLGSVQGLVRGSDRVMPDAAGASCGSAECEVVPIVIGCTSAPQCGYGRLCEQGICVEDGTTQSSFDWLGSWEGVIIRDEPVDPSLTVRLVITPGRWTYNLSNGEVACVRAGDWVLEGSQFRGVIVTENCNPEAVGTEFTQPIPEVSGGGNELTIVNPDGTTSQFRRIAS